jgi:prefoldin beta subunit
MSADARINKLLGDLQKHTQLLNTLAVQEATLKSEIETIKRVLEELEKLPDDVELYKNLGHVMVRAKKEDVVNELKNKLEVLEVKLTSVTSQKKAIEEEIAKLKKELEKLMSGGGVGGG